MDIRQYIRPDLAVSAIAHLSLVALVAIYVEAHPFETVVEDAVPVEIVVADQVEKKPPDPTPTPTPQPSPDLFDLAKPGSPKPSPAAAAQPSSPPPAKQSTQANRREPQPQAPPAPAASSAPAASAAPGYSAPEPDLTVRYHVMLGLPEALPAPAASGDKLGEGGDATPASSDLSASLVEPLRRHLKTCSKLPAALSPTDNIAVKLRIQMTPDGRLAGEPALIEGSASMKGVELMRGAVAALAACQPYAMLPADRYGEWKVLDLSFTPRDFNS
jgi:outer membrane biosynthesis protein TonB